ncbi:MAG: RdgB/HAM1 family non-canonical purine NTP pyrophosphatase [Chloroflexi bacterium]|nr:RdgB/HAM1 family non-canonical purine NTP pyrophosphatase [Chloroflexota bacterium]
MRLLIGSSNPDKVREYRQILAGLDVELVAPSDLDPAPAEPAEDGPSFEENALTKALGYARATGLATLADDSGLEVSALRGAPGVRSRRFFGDRATAAERNAALLALLDGVADRAARFVCVAVLAFPDGRTESFRGECAGAIGVAPRGTNGFGYDPVFVLADGRTMAELPPSEKHRLSHRGRAGQLVRARLTRGW